MLQDGYQKDSRPLLWKSIFHRKNEFRIKSNTKKQKHTHSESIDNLEYKLWPKIYSFINLKQWVRELRKKGELWMLRSKLSRVWETDFWNWSAPLLIISLSFLLLLEIKKLKSFSTRTKSTEVRRNESTGWRRKSSRTRWQSAKINSGPWIFLILWGEPVYQLNARFVWSIMSGRKLWC